jgi:hypothetical protein
MARFLEFSSGRSFSTNTEMIDVTSMSDSYKVDPTWVWADLAGHVHRGTEIDLTTAWSVVGSHWCEDCREDHHDYERFCRVCATEVDPPLVVDVPAGMPRSIAGMTTYLIDGDPVDEATFRAELAKEQQGMNEITLMDDFGRRTVFTGEKLLEESTDTNRSIKPQWLEVEVWRTEGGNFVVLRKQQYRIHHLDEECSRAEGYDLSPATEEDTYACPTCNKTGILGQGWSQDSRVTVDVCNTPQDLIANFQVDGRFSNLARTILADLSELDERLDAAWNTVRVP